MLTRLRQTFGFVYVDHGFQTDVRMLPQSGPLKRGLETRCGVITKRARARSPMVKGNAMGKEGWEIGGRVITKRARSRCRSSTLSRGERREPPSPGPYGQFFSRSKVSVFVLDKRKKPLMPCSEKRARQLLEKCRAVVHRLFPFTIRLKDRVDGETQPVRIKVDPGSKTTGVAVVRRARRATARPPPGRDQASWGIDPRSSQTALRVPEASARGESPLSRAPLRQSTSPRRMAPTLARKPNLPRADLGRSPVPALPDHDRIARVGQVRPSEARGS